MRRKSIARRAVAIKPIGVVESSLTDPADAPNQGDRGAPNAWLLFNREVREAMSDLKVGDQIIVLTWLHRAKRDVLRTYPGNQRRAPHRGVFSLRSPDRPNPIGLHPVKVLEVADLRIRVNHMEAIDGTPIVDVKPVI